MSESTLNLCARRIFHRRNDTQFICDFLDTCGLWPGTEVTSTEQVKDWLTGLHPHTFDAWAYWLVMG